MLAEKSAVAIILCLVLQGSVQSQHLFILYMVDLADTVSAHDVKHHAYVNDPQLYLQCQLQAAIMAPQRLEMCITDVQRWMEVNRLKLTANKTRASLGWVQIRSCCPW